MSEILFSVRGLRVEYRSRGQVTPVLNGVDLDVVQGETLALIGESGSGKTTFGRAALRLVEPQGGELWFDGQAFHSLRGAALRALRRQAQMIFQNPFNSLNPRMKVEALIAEPLLTHERLSARQRREKVIEVLQEVGLTADMLTRYPHQLSGGQAQRIGIARALILKPRLLVLDEPTSALDVSIQAQILNLLVNLQERYALTYLFISHNLAVVRHISHRVAVLRAGNIIETNTTERLFMHPSHPYTQTLLAALNPPAYRADTEKDI